MAVLASPNSNGSSGTIRSLWLTRRFEVGLACLIASFVLLSFATWDGLANLFSRWSYEPEYGYGFLIAPLVPLLLWGRVDTASSSSNESWKGLLIIIVAQLCAVLAALGESYYFEQLAFVVSLFGLGLVVFGSNRFMTLLPLMILLLMAIPLPYTLQAILTIKLQLISTEIGVFLIRLLNVPVYVEGNIIDLGVYKLQVAEACSGLRYLLPLTCISFLVAYLYKSAFWKKVVIVASAIPLTIGFNSFRIAVTAILVKYFGPQMADGFLHEFEGWIVFLLGMLVLWGEVLALEGFHARNLEFNWVWKRSAGADYQDVFRRRAPILFLTTIVCALSVGCIGSIAYALKSDAAPPRVSFSERPLQLEHWTRYLRDLDAETEKALKPTDSYIADYTDDTGGAPVNLFVAYYAALNKSGAIHSPRVCLPASGWEFASLEENKFSDIQPNLTGSYNRAVIQNGTKKILMYYWYQQGARRTANEFQMKYNLLVDSLTKHRQDGALVRLFIPIPSGSGDGAEMQAEVTMRRFAENVLPKLSSYLPQ